MGKIENPWTDYELGFLQDHADWKSPRIAKELGRSLGAIYKKRSLMRCGWAPIAAPAWSKAEDDFILANPRMLAPDVAAHLGRTEFAVKGRRQRLKGLGLVSGRFGGNCSPFQIGNRPLLAKTCPKCGLLLQAAWFNSRAGNFRNSHCHRCQHLGDGPHTQTARQRKQSKAAQDRLQALTLPMATQKGQRWNEADMSVLQDPDMTLLQKALTLHRTFNGTKYACGVNGFKSKRGLGDPEKDQWIIDNPNAERVEEIVASLAPLAPAETNQPSAPQWDWDESDLKVSA